MKGKLKGKKNSKPLELTKSLFFGMASFILFFMGFVMFAYIIIERIKFSEIENIIFWPPHYLILAVICLGVSLYHKAKE